MSLHHTIRLFDRDFKELLPSLVENHYEPTVILTEIIEDYFPEGITSSAIQDFGEDLLKIMNTFTGVYLVVDFYDIPEVLTGLKETGLEIRNILNIPLTTTEEDEGCCCRKFSGNNTRYYDNDSIYVIYATRSCGSRNFSFTRLINKDELSSKYPVNWNWFKGNKIDAFQVMIKISSNHRDEVFDPFMNIGDVGEAVIKADRHFTGTERDGLKFHTAKDRLDALGE